MALSGIPLSVVQLNGGLNGGLNGALNGALECLIVELKSAILGCMFIWHISLHRQVTWNILQICINSTLSQHSGVL